MNKRWTHLLTGLVVIGLLFPASTRAAAQDELPPRIPEPIWPEDRPSFVIEDEALRDSVLTDNNGLYIMQGSLGAEQAEEEQVEAAASYSSADAFGYRYQKVTPAWINATSEEPLDISVDSYMELTLPFPFRFYGIVYETINVSRNGYLRPGQPLWQVRAQSKIGDDAEPNNVIAPYWAPLNMDHGNIYALSGGEAPNRWMAVEWYNAADALDGSGNFTFEVVLYENGQILFQYDLMEYPWNWYCATAGIEERNGLVSKTSLKFCSKQASYKAIKFVPPSPSGRVWMYNDYDGGLAMPGETIEYWIYVQNIGDKGVDTIDLSLSSKWNGQLLHATEEGVLPLTDTDGDKKLDTGPLEEGQGEDIVVRISVPLTAKVGNRSEAALKATSSLNTKKSKTLRIHTAVPTNFALTFDRRIFAYEPAGRIDTSPDADGWWQQNGLVENTTGRLFFFGITDGCVDEECNEYASWLKTSIIEHDTSPVGQFIVDEERDLSSLYQGYPAAAPAPDGSVGFAWMLQEYDEERAENIQNIYFTSLNANGEVVTARTSVTNNENARLLFYDPKISAADDGKFVVTWDQYKVDYNPLQSTQYAVLNPDGSLAFGPATLGQGEYVYPSHYTHNRDVTVTQLAGNKALLAWSQSTYKNKTRKTSYSLEYAVVDSSGAVVKRSSISTGSTPIYDSDAVQMSGGQIVLAWEGYSSSKNKIYYAILSGTSYKTSKGPTALNSSSKLSSGTAVSVTRDASNHAVLTWIAGNQKQLYYALLGKNGTVLTSPMVYYSGLVNAYVGSAITLEVGRSGQNNTTFTTP